MALNFPGIFPPERGINVTYDWVDLASATGYVSYDCFSTVDGTSVKSLLVESNNRTGLRSVTTYYQTGVLDIVPNCFSSGEIDQTSYTMELDKSFDSGEFQLPRTIRGKAFVTFFNYIRTNSGTGIFWYFVVRLRIWDGASETEIANVTTEEYEYVNDQTLLHSVELDVPQTSIKKGEQLRLTIEGWGKRASGGSAYILIAGDPANLICEQDTYDIPAGDTRIILHVPFKIDQ